MGVSESRAAVARAIASIDTAVVEPRHHGGATLSARRAATDAAHLADDVRAP